MGKSVISDFVVDTIGYCFICLNKIHSQRIPKKEKPESLVQSSIHSLQYVSRYLKIQMRKVFRENDSIPEELLLNVERSTLKVSLCERCAGWNAKLSELFQQLEKIEVEAASYLELVHGQLMEADEHGRDHVFRKLDDCNFADGFTGKLKLEIAEAVRMETIQKCSRTLNIVQPKVKIKKLNDKEVRLVVNVNASNTTVSRSNTQFATNLTEAYPSASELLNEEINLESANFNETSNDSGHDYSDNLYNLPDECEDIEQPDFSSSTEDYVQYRSSSNVKSSDYQQHLRKSKTGKVSCKLCSKQFATIGTFSTHYNNAHLKIRFQCKICNKIFTQRANLIAHQQSVHLKQRFNCQFCSKSFSSVANRSHHIRLGKCSESHPPVTSHSSS